MENSPTVNDVQSILCRKNIILLLDLFYFFIPFPPIFPHYLTKLTDANLKDSGLEPIIQSEVSQKEKHKYSILTHIYGI